MDVPGFNSRVNLRGAARILVAGLATAVGSSLLVGQVAASAGDSQSPYTIVYEAQLSGVANNAPITPEGPEAFKAAFAHTPANVVVCDDQGTSTGNIDCEHQAVTDHAAAFIVTQANQDQSLVDGANIPVLGVANDTSPQSFDLSGQQGVFAGMAVALYKNGCRNIGIATVEGGQSYSDQTQKAEHWQSVTDSYFPLGAPDLSAAIAKLAQGHVQCIALATIGSQIAQFLTALKQSSLHVTVAMPGIIVTPSIAKSLGALGNGMLLIETTPATTSAASQRAAKEIHKINKRIQIDATSLSIWATAQIMKDAIKNTHGPVTNTSLLAALNKLRNADTGGLYPPISMTPQSNPATTRDFDTYVQTFVLKNGGLTKPSGYYDVGKQINVALTNR